MYRIVKRMKLLESHLRKIIRKELVSLREETGAPAKAGSATASAEGNLDVKKIADTLGLDSSKLKTAVVNIRAQKRNAADDKVFGDMIAKLINASPEDTVKVMNVLKKVSEEGNE